MTAVKAQPFRVLLYAHVDLNVIDGSAFFVAGAASLLTSAPGVQVDVVAATPITRSVVVQEMLVNDRVTVTDPFADPGLAVHKPEFEGARRMDEGMAASALDHYLDRAAYDVVIVRSTEVADELAQRRPDLGRRLCVYVTGVVAADAPIGEEALARLERLVVGEATLLCQTPEMRDHLGALLRANGSTTRLAVMSPSVPAENEAILPGTDGPLVLAYTGKFAPAWHTVEMLAAFKEAASAGADLRMLVAGDHFKRAPEWPTFGAEVRYLLESHPGISWRGAVTRAEARQLVSSAHAGIGWRHPSLDTSLELSTKLLEHGVLGRPCVINPTAMHQRLFGADYPLFASSMTEFVALLGRMASDRGLVRAAAETAVDVAEGYTYERVFRDVFPTLVDAALGDSPPRGDISASVRALVTSDERLVTRDGWTVAWLADSADAARVLAASQARDELHAVERMGPFVRWSSDGATPSSAGRTTVPTLELVVDVLAAERSAGTGAAKASAGEVGPTTVVHDAAGRLGLVPAAEPARDARDAPGVSGATGTPRSSSPRSERAGTPRTADATLRTEIEHLSADLARQVKETQRLKDRYEALSGSRLGRLQLSYWEMRSRRRRRPPTDDTSAVT
ncbi:hypothetical protein [Cellulomonas fimi]|uniref:Glycosyltransferase family 4 protein n=1 Tax=Cellulomonas fimi TaxID=1708 RepID=A0A7Y0LZY9_CELFI|nr:hypothetical protein [Cellulomonas fimi]NMR20533.1 glycosyltransferase family 4 protein [Cellulomonas fimi]